MYYVKFYRNDRSPLLGSDSYHKLDGRLCLSNKIKQAKNIIDGHVKRTFIDSFEIRKGNIREYKTIEKIQYNLLQRH